MSFYYSFLPRLTAALGTLRREEGQTFTEYAIIVAGIAIGAVGVLRTAVTNALTSAASNI